MKTQFQIETDVVNLATGFVYTFTLSPTEALISAAIIGDKKTLLVSDAKTRLAYKQKIRTGNKTLAIGDWCTLQENEA